MVCAYTVCTCVFAQVCMWAHTCLCAYTQRSFIVTPNLRFLFYYLFEWKKWTYWHRLSKDLLRNTKLNKSTFCRTMNAHHPKDGTSYILGAYYFWGFFVAEGCMFVPGCPDHGITTLKLHYQQFYLANSLRLFLAYSYILD